MLAVRGCPDLGGGSGLLRAQPDQDAARGTASLHEGGSSPASHPSVTAGDKDQARRSGLQATYAPRSATRPLGNVYPSSVSQKGDAAAMKICKLPFTAASYLPCGDGYHHEEREFIRFTLLTHHYSSSFLIPNPMS